MANNRHEINYKIEGNDWEALLTKSFDKANKEVEVKGYRKGKTPRDVFENKFGRESLFTDAMEYGYEEAFKAVIVNGDFEPLARPVVEVVDCNNDGCEFKFTIVTKPEVKLDKYTNLGIKEKEVKVSKEEISAEIDRLLENFSELAIKEEGKVENGNVAVIDFEGFKDGVPFDGGKAVNYELEIGSHSFIEGFEEGLIGLAVNDEKDLELTFPENYMSEELKGAKVVFKVLVKEIKEKIKPEFTEDFFQDLNIEGVNSEETLTSYVVDSLTAAKTREVETEYYDTLFETLRNNMEVTIDEEIIKEEQDRIFENFEQRVKMQGIDINMYYQFANTDKETLLSQMREDAIKNISYRFIMEYVADKENITVTEEEANAEIDKLAEMYKMSREELIDNFGSLDMLMFDIKMKKTVDFLKENNK